MGYLPYNQHPGIRPVIYNHPIMHAEQLIAGDAQFLE